MQKMPIRSGLSQGATKALEKNHFLIAVSGSVNHRIPRFRNSPAKIYKNGVL